MTELLTGMLSSVVAFASQQIAKTRQDKSRTCIQQGLQSVQVSTRPRLVGGGNKMKVYLFYAGGFAQTTLVQLST